MNSWSTEDLEDRRNALYETIIIDAGHDTFVKTH